MKSKSEAFIDCVKRASKAYQILALAQSDCKIMIDAELDLLAKENGSLLSPESKSIVKKIAKAVSAEKTDSIKSEAKVFAQGVADFFNEPIFLSFPRDTDEQ